MSLNIYSTASVSFFSQEHEFSSERIDENLCIKKISSEVFASMFHDVKDVDMDEMEFVKIGHPLHTSGVYTCVALVAQTLFDNKILLSGIFHYCLDEQSIDAFLQKATLKNKLSVNLYLLGGASLISHEDYRYKAIFNALNSYKEHVKLRFELINPLKLKSDNEYTPSSSILEISTCLKALAIERSF